MSGAAGGTHWAWDALTAAPQEERGRRFAVWGGAEDGAAFNPFVGAAYKATILAPVGWHLDSDPRYGAELRNAFGDRADPQIALLWANAHANGFRLLSCRHYPGGLRSMRDV